MSSSTAKRTLMLMLGLFLLPVLLAAAVLQFGWYQGGSTNQGRLLSELSYQQINQPNPFAEQWQIITYAPSNCAADCQQQLQQLSQAHIALGREQRRVVPIVYSAAPMLLPERLVPVIAAPLQAPLAPYALVVVDPLGQWVLGYPPGQTQAMLKDLRKLLKLSRIG
ncbi:hypothetical protein [Ferrimonas senticii]|uniref:hypothetical protein n=1 Tax=Ferrimonas senticii TaxID=394566 RepID=UPI0004149ED1|nr:hypothetical protein [Ferrimonas senticii]